MEPDNDSAHGLVQLEGYLLWNSEVEEARRRAGLFCEQLPWLTTAQREDVERVYTDDRLAASKAMLVHVSERATELRGEYSARYEQLKKRCVATAVVGAGALSGACTVFTVIGRG
ncbi:hypothetical protein [Streptomyces tsukubensis]|uniref:Cytochrome C oxidase subunit I n=1 Tax=Streptomyces tsukubensis TaxID=83656 RepID=A0A1V4AG26_9ACTN|nr:hypothetical protein [Streptomyces tsukubensis]OON82615.1 hypothetical protein B1H18_00660 [Streptomyces tsukubensis]QFR92213.1 hypothetical protein GBW32_03030 [Streptomyces tsukubensis]